MKCKSCNKILPEEKFILNTRGKRYLDECKSCVYGKYDYKTLTNDIETGFEDLLRKMDVPYIANVYNSCSSIGGYMRIILSMPQYKGLRFKDSVFSCNDHIEMRSEITDDINKSTISYRNDGVIDFKVQKVDIIEILDEEIDHLIRKFKQAREENNIGTFKNLFLAFKEVYNMRKEELEDDWKLMYSEYSTGGRIDNTGSYIKKQVAIWQQNSKGQVRNHKVWNVEEKDSFAENIREHGIEVAKEQIDAINNANKDNSVISYGTIEISDEDVKKITKEIEEELKTNKGTVWI